MNVYKHMHSDFAELCLVRIVCLICFLSVLGRFMLTKTRLDSHNCRSHNQLLSLGPGLELGVEFKCNSHNDFSVEPPIQNEGNSAVFDWFSGHTIMHVSPGYFHGHNNSIKLL